MMPVSEAAASVYRLDFSQQGEPMGMGRVVTLTLTLAVAFVSQAAAAIITTGPYQWQVAGGGNDHYYMLVMPDSPQTTDDNFSWFEARNAAAATIYNGSAGHLVTVTSFGEDEFLRTTFENEIEIRNYPTSTGDFVWIGLTDQTAEGNYQWLTGESFSYSNWASTEPNNLGNEDFVHIWRRYEGTNQDGWSWNDKQAGPFLPDSRWGYIVEFDGPFVAPVPEPTTLAIWSLLSGIGLVVGHRKRRRKAV
ncbi:MAG: hypothetical protein H8E66_23375 [Planctomycetes bacterium]|nr:hypothetical protein [Planctomycetota bacterium]